MKVLFIHPTLSAFIESDLRILRNHFEVRVIDLGNREKGIGSMMRVAFEMLRGVMWADVTYSWFAENHAKWAIRLGRLFGVPSIVVVGGYEVAKIPEIGHGSLLDPRKAEMVTYVLTRASKVLPVDESLKEEAIKNLGIDGKNIQSVSTGFDPSTFKPAGTKDRMVLTIGFIDKVTIKRKGLDVFVQAAKHLPNVKFVLVGSSKDDSIDLLKSVAPPNVEFVGYVPHEQVLGYYQRAKVYCQLSMYEGLPNALCEAMLCECVPVGTKVSGIPNAIGDTGFYVPVGDPKAAAEAIRQALVSDKGKAARARISERFPVELREKTLVDVIHRLR